MCDFWLRGFFVFPFIHFQYYNVVDVLDEASPMFISLRLEKEKVKVPLVRVKSTMTINETKIQKK